VVQLGIDLPACLAELPFSHRIRDKRGVRYLGAAKTRLPMYNLEAPNGLLEPVDLQDLGHWFSYELCPVKPTSVRHILEYVSDNLDDFVRWPNVALLLWDGCDRIKPKDRKGKYHAYPGLIKQSAKGRINLDGRPNGPAIAAFEFAGGERPKRFGSSNSWTIHHLYSGKFPHVVGETPFHAVRDGKHFTQSAGLVATHEIADALCDEFPCFSWLLRAKAFQKFFYDPSGVFSDEQDGFGFAVGHPCDVLHCQQ
jgi:hypothetical protein